MLNQNRRSGQQPRGPFQDKRCVLTTRITEATRAALEAASEATGRSMSQEIEVRLEASFRLDDQSRILSDVFYGPEFASLLELIAKVMRDSGIEAARRAGAGRTDWLDSQEGYDQAVLAAIEVLKRFCPGGPGKSVPKEAKAETGVSVAKRAIALFGQVEQPTQDKDAWAHGLWSRLGRLRERIMPASE